MSAITDILGDLETGKASSDYSQSNNNAYPSDHTGIGRSSSSRIRDKRPPSAHSHSRSRSRSGTPTRNYEPSQHGHERTNNNNDNAYHSDHTGRSSTSRIRDNRNKQSSSSSSRSRSTSRSGTPTRNYEPSNERRRNASYESSSGQDQHQHQHKYGEDRHRRQRLQSQNSDRQRSSSSSIRRDQQRPSPHIQIDPRYSNPERHGMEVDDHKEQKKISKSFSSSSDDLEGILDKSGTISNHEFERNSDEKGRLQRNVRNVRKVPVEGKYEHEREVWSENHMGKPPTGKSKHSAMRYNDSAGERRKKNSNYDSNIISAPSEESSTNRIQKSQSSRDYDSDIISAPSRDASTNRIQTSQSSSREHEKAVAPKGEQQLGSRRSRPAPQQELEIIKPPTGKSKVKNNAIRYNDNGNDNDSQGRNPETERRRKYSDQDSNKMSAPSEDSTNRKKKSQSSREHETAVVPPTGEKRLEPRRPRPVPQHNFIEKESAILSCLESRKTKRIAILALIYCVIASAICGWLVSQFVRIPGLRDEINDLKVQVDRLAIEVDEFTIENDRLGDEVDRLDDINNDLDKTVASIAEQKEQAEELAKQLNETLLEFKKQNEELKGQNDQLIQTTDALRGDVANLTLNLDDVKETEAQLKKDVEELKAVEERLKEDKITLTAQAQNLSSTVEKLSEEVLNFKKENMEFKELNEELRQIVSFIDDEAANVEETYEALTSYLADAIIRKQVLTMTALKEGMKKELAAWECGFRTAFSGQDFLKDENVSIGYSSYDTVMSYTDKFLQNLCLLRGNLETFLVNEVIVSGQRIWEISSKDLSAGINIYTANALDHYFPDEGEEGLSSTYWDEIDYDCSELPIEQRYYYAVA